ncbi:hypothetical protein FACS189493_6810 [Spirochaetia bacterium]|nr:hypothetical protein FACS189493_6810 [Spirochaetia bacterium]
MRLKKHRVVSFSKNILILLALSGITAFAVRPLQQEIHTRMAALRDSLIARGEEYLGLGIEYDSMGPSIFGTLDVRGIRIYGKPGSDPLVSITRLRVAYSLPTLIRGDFFAALRLIVVDKPELTLDLNRIGELDRLRARLAGAGSSPIGGPVFSRPVRLRLRGGAGQVYQGEDYARLTGLSADAEFDGERITVRGKWDLRAALEHRWGISLSGDMQGRLAGNYAISAGEGKFSLSVPSLTADTFNLQPVKFDITLDKRGIAANTVNAPFELRAGYAFDTRHLTASFAAENFSPRSLVSLSGPLEQYNQYLAISISGDADFALDADRAIEYNLDLSGNLGTLPIGRIAYAIKGRGDAERIRLSNLGIRLPQGGLGFSGVLDLSPLAPNGVLSISNFSLSGGGEVNGELTIGTSGREITLFAESLSLGEVLLSALDAEFTREEEGMIFSASALRFTGLDSYEDVSVSRLAVEGSLDYAPRHLQASLILDAFSMADVLGIIRPFVAIDEFFPLVSAAINDTAITTEVFVTTDFNQILYSAPRSVVAYQGLQEVVALFSLSGTDRRVEINQGRIVWGSAGVDISGYTDFSNLNDISFNLETSYMDLVYYLEGGLLDQRSLRIQGSYGISVSIEMTPSGGYSGYIETQAIPIPMGGQFATLQFLVAIRYEAADFWSVNLARLEVQDLLTPASPYTTVRASGVVDQDGAVFRELFIDDGLGALSGQVRVYRDRRTENYIARFHMADAAGREAYDLEGTYQNGVLDLTADVAQMQLGRVLENPFNVVVSAGVQLHLVSREDYTLDLTLSSLSARNGDDDIRLSAAALLTPDDILISNLALNYGRLQANLPRFLLNRRDTLAETEARIRGTLIGRTIDVSFAARAEFEGIDSWFSLPRALESFAGTIDVSHIRVDTLETSDPFGFEFFRSEGRMALNGGPQNMIRASLSDAGALYAGLSYPSPIRGSVVGTLTPRTIDAQATDLYIDLASLWRFIPSRDIVYCTGGFVNASIRIQGSLGDPEFFGTAQGNSVRLMVPQFVEAEIGPTPMTITLAGNEMTFGPLTTPVGTGSADISGWFRFDRWIPNTFNLDIVAPESHPLPVDLVAGGVIVQGGASGHLVIAMEDLILTVSGNIIAENAEITMVPRDDTASREAARSSGSAPVIVDLSVTTGLKVEFFWPNTTTPILQATANLGSVLGITSDSVTGSFSLDGDIGLRRGEIYYFERSFYLRQGMLSFNENEIRFEPRLTARAEIRDRTEDGPVTISMIVDNAPLQSFTARFEAVPALSQVIHKIHVGGL